MKKMKWLRAAAAATLVFGTMSVKPLYAEGDIPEEVTETQETVNGKYVSENDPSIEGFVVRLYKITLQREPDAGGYAYWTDGIRKGTITGCTAVRGFFLSAEMSARNLNDEAFVRSLYKAVLNREADSAGLADWVNRLSIHMTREYVMNGFLNSQEFTNLCGKYGVTKGSTISTSAYRDRNYLVTAFVNRLYTKVLGRASDVGGVEGWTKKVYTESATGADLAAGFFLSPEYAKKNTSNDTYVKTLYRAILDREGSAKEVSGWTAKLTSGKSRKEVLAGFVNSAEFNNLCKKYGIERGTLTLGGWKIVNGKYYYYKDDGTMAKKEILTISGKQYGFTAKGTWIGEKNASYLSAYGKAISLVNSITNDSMTEDQKMRACFSVFKNFTQKNPWIPHDNSEGWVERYANHCFDTHIGNCMSYAACFGIMVQVLGVEEIYCCNNWGHGWTEINGLIYDPEAALHSSLNFYARHFDDPGAGMKYWEAIDRSVKSSVYVKL